MTGLASWSRNLAFAKSIRYPRMPFHIYKTVNDRFYPHPRVVNFWINATFPVTLKLYEITGFILLQTAWLSKNPITQNIGYYFYTIYLQKLQDPFKNLYNKIWKFCKIFEIFTLLLLFTKTWIILFKIKKPSTLI